MDQMKELYAKVAADSALQAKFAEILKDAESAGKAATEAKLIAFAKDAGYDVTKEEAKAFFEEKAKADAELNDAELEMVAGGKQTLGQWVDGAIRDVSNFFDDVGDTIKNAF